MYNNGLHKNNNNIRILHVFHSLGFGGAEKWLVHMLRHVDQQKYQIDIMIHEEREGYAEEIKTLGAKIIVCPYSINPWIYGKNFKSILRQHGPYDIVQSHLATAGFHALWAHQQGVPIRLVQKHTDEKLELRQSNSVKNIGVKVSNLLVSGYATAGVAVSRSAAQRFGRQWERDPRWQILYLGIDLAEFTKEIDRERLRQELGIPRDSLVVGHVGRFTQEKNHGFLLDIFAKTVGLKPCTVLLLVGDGPLRREIEIKAARLGIAEKVLFTGLRKDVPILMKGAMDVFLLPSLYEGLPLVLMETQAAGLNSIISNKITEEADIVKPLIKRLFLTDFPDVWAHNIIRTANEKREISQGQALRIMEQSPFNIETSCNKLFELYDKLNQSIFSGFCSNK